jgi:ATP-dependent Clp protease ATP-binding subunit ClpA
MLYNPTIRLLEGDNILICLSCKRRPATMTADILVDGKLNTLKLCGLCAHRAQMQRTWDGKGWRAAEGKTHFTGDLSSPIPSGTSNVVFTAITKRGQRVMEWAESESIRFGVGGIASTAILISLLTEEGSASYEILREMGVDLDKAFLALNKALKEESSRDGGPYEQIDARSLLSEAQRRASDFNDAVVEPEHIMLALLDGEKSLALEILLRLGVNLKELKARLFYYLECQRMERDIRGQPAPIFRQMTPLEQVVGDAPAGGSILHFFSRDLVQEARETNFDTSVGRDDLVERLVRVLCRERRNNPLLVGDSVVGKTYLVEALAKRVAGGDVPAPLREVSIAELDTVALMEGASMQGELAKRVIGQDRAIKVVSETVRRSRAGLSDQKHPIGTFLFMGSTGVGKTEVAKSLAEFLFDDERAMVRLDMSEFSEQHSVAKLIGSPPGWSSSTALMRSSCSIPLAKKRSGRSSSSRWPPWQNR